MRQLAAIALLIMVSMTVMAASEQSVERSSSSSEAIDNLRGLIANLAQPGEGIYSGGQPTAEAATWQQLRALGVTTVINLRTEAEMAGIDEREQVADAGLTYVSIPVAGAGDVNQQNADLLRRIIEQTNGSVLVHCASGNRVGALLAINAAERRSLSVDEAIRYGKAAGLTSLEARTRELLQARD